AEGDHIRGTLLLPSRVAPQPVHHGEEDLAREEAVGAGILAGDGLPLRAARARREDRVLAVRGEPGGRRHRPAVYHGHGGRIQAGGSSTTEPRSPLTLADVWRSGGKEAPLAEDL